MKTMKLYNLILAHDIDRRCPSFKALVPFLEPLKSNEKNFFDKLHHEEIKRRQEADYFDFVVVKIEETEDVVTILFLLNIIDSGDYEYALDEKLNLQPQCDKEERILNSIENNVATIDAKFKTNVKFVMLDRKLLLTRQPKITLILRPIHLLSIIDDLDIALYDTSCGSTVAVDRERRLVREEFAKKVDELRNKILLCELISDAVFHILAFYLSLNGLNHLQDQLVLNTIFSYISASILMGWAMTPKYHCAWQRIGEMNAELARRINDNISQHILEEQNRNCQFLGMGSYRRKENIFHGIDYSKHSSVALWTNDAVTIRFPVLSKFGTTVTALPNSTPKITILDVTREFKNIESTPITRELSKIYRVRDILNCKK